MTGVQTCALPIWAGNSNGSGNITLGLTGSTVTGSAPSGGGAAYSEAWAVPEIYGNSTFTTFANGTVYVRAIELNGYADLDRMMLMNSWSSGTISQSFSASVSSQTSSGATGSWGLTGTALFFTRNNTNETHASYNSLNTYSSTTYSMSAGYTAAMTWSTNVSSCTISVSTTAGIGAIKSIDGAGNITTTGYLSNGSTSFSSTSTNQNSFKIGRAHV